MYSIDAKKAKMFFLPWFDLQEDYISYYTSTFEVNHVSIEEAKQMANGNDTHKSHKKQARNSDRPEPALRERYHGAITLPDYDYFVHELFPHFGIKIHPSRLPNGTQHKLYSQRTATGDRMSGVQSIDNAKELESHTDKMLDVMNADRDDMENRNRCKKALINAGRKH